MLFCIYVFVDILKCEVWIFIKPSPQAIWALGSVFCLISCNFIHNNSPSVSVSLHIGHNNIQPSLLWTSIIHPPPSPRTFLASLYYGIWKTCPNHPTLWAFTQVSIHHFPFPNIFHSSRFSHISGLSSICFVIIHSSFAYITVGLTIVLYKRNFAALEIILDLNNLLVAPGALFLFCYSFLDFGNLIGIQFSPWSCDYSQIITIGNHLIARVINYSISFHFTLPQYCF